MIYEVFRIRTSSYINTLFPEKKLDKITLDIVLFYMMKGRNEIDTSVSPST